MRSQTSQDILAEHDLQPRTNTTPTICGNKAQTVAMGMARASNGPRCNPQGCHAIDPRRKEKTEPAKRDMEKICREGDEYEGLEPGSSADVGEGQTTLAVPGVGLMCNPTRRGINK